MQRNRRPSGNIHSKTVEVSLQDTISKISNIDKETFN